MQKTLALISKINFTKNNNKFKTVQLFSLFYIFIQCGVLDTYVFLSKT